MGNIKIRLSKIKNIEYKLLFFVILLGFLVRLYKIENPVADWHSWRQADTASVSRVYAERSVDLLFPRYHDISTIQTGEFNPNGYRFVEFPILNVAHAFLANVFSFFSLEIWGRLISVIASVISSLLLFYLGKRFIGTWAGIIASFFFLFIPFNVYFSRVILPEPLVVTFGLASLVFFVAFLDTDKFWKLYLAGLFMALGVLVKPFILFYSIPMIYLLVKKYAYKRILNEVRLLIPLLIFAGLIITPFVLWRSWIGNYPEGIPFWKWAFNGDKIRFRPSFWRWIFGERLGHLILGSWGLVPFAIGLLNETKDHFEKYFFLGALVYLSLIATANVRHDYYQTLIVPSMCLILASGSIWLWKTKAFNRTFTRIILVFSIGVGFITGALQVNEFYKINHSEIILAGNAVDATIPKEALVIAPYNADTAFLYQTKRWGWPFMDRAIDELIEKGADYYVSVNYDSKTNELIEMFETVKKTEAFVILDLSKTKK